jgi:hypothetical protein
VIPSLSVTRWDPVKNSQIIKIQIGAFGIDLSRTTGPWSSWKDKKALGVRKVWHENYEALLKNLVSS